jgi:hypothetical protein
VVFKWLSSYKFFREAQKLFASKQRLKESIRAMRRADRLLGQLLPYLRNDPRVPSIRVEYIGRNRWMNLKATDFLHLPGEKGILEWIADWISEIKPQRGRPPQTVLANCAEELAAVFKERTGRSRWEKVGQVVAKAFAEYLPIDDGTRDHRLWILKLVKRNRTRKKKFTSITSPKSNRNKTQ